MVYMYVCQHDKQYFLFKHIKLPAKYAESEHVFVLVCSWFTPLDTSFVTFLPYPGNGKLVHKTGKKTSGMCQTNGGHDREFLQFSLD